MSAPPPLLYLSGISLSFGGDPLLDGAQLSVSRHARLCLIGRNGSGKSTLLKVAAGLVEPDHGEVFVQPGIVVRYLAQSPVFPETKTTEEVILEDVFGNEDRQKAYQLMADLHIQPDAYIKNLSGGELRRVALAQAMACQPDILLLDEPTNHLDLPAIEWLESVLRSHPAALVLVSHDRRFLQNMATETVWLDRGKTHNTGTSFSHFEDWRDRFFEQEAVSQDKLDRKIAREEDWLRHGVSGRRRRNVRRVKELFELRNTRDTYLGPTGSVSMESQEGENSGKLVVKFDHVSKSYGDHVLIKDLSFIIARGNRVGLVGPNGAGKTTLLKMILGEERPDTGIIRLGKKLEPLILDQKRSGIQPDWTIKDALTDGAGDLVSVGEETVHVIGYMRQFLFHASQMRTPANILSGGELARLLLARGLRQSSNFLVMDEPTNDLDLETLDLLQEMLASYPGTIIIVSHDRDFLDRTVSHTIASEGEGIWTLYSGGYSDMMAQKKNAAADLKEARPSLSADKNMKEKSGGGRKARMSYKQGFRLEQLPSEIDALNLTIEALEAKLADTDFFGRDPNAFHQSAANLERLKQTMIELEEEWLALEMLREELNS
jgi:ABC transport system ATP-binding/permease protein